MGRFLFIVVVSLFSYGNGFNFTPTFNFEGLDDKEQVLDYYNGGYGSKGNTGGNDNNYNVTFSQDATVLKNSTGNFTNTPSGNTALYIDKTNSILINVPDGWSDGFSFYYTSVAWKGKVIIYPEEQGNGKPIKISFLKNKTSTNYNRWVTKSIAFDGIAKSVRLESEEKRMGFDNITLDNYPPHDVGNFKLSLATVPGIVGPPIYHPHKESLSTRFRIILKGKSLTDINGNNKDDITKICDNYFFKIIAKDGHGAVEKKCEYKKYGNKYYIFIDFKINKTSIKEYYFKEGKLYICEENNHASCLQLPIVKDFNIIGTGFTLNRDAYKFKNGDWAKNHILFTKMFRASLILMDYLKEDEYKSFWNGIGTTFSFDLPIIGNVEFNTPSDGGCGGMVLSSIANYNHFELNNGWGNSQDISNWKTEIDTHWDYPNKKVSSTASFKALDLYPEFYNYNSVNAFKKIMYYQVGHSPWKGKDTKSWIGKQSSSHDFTTSTEREELKTILRKGSPFEVIIDFKDSDTSHAIAATQYISYNNIDKWYFYDNNHPKEYTHYVVANNMNYATFSKLHNTIIYRGQSKQWEIQSIFGSVGDDPFNIYGNIVDTFVNPGKISAKLVSQKNRYLTKNTSTKESYTYNLSQYTNIYIVGARFKKVIDTSTNTEIVTSPYLGGDPSPHVVYQQNNNLFSNQIFLPKNKTYKIVVEKDKNVPFIKIFSTIPDDKGDVTLIHYDNIEVDENDATMATFTIGINNKNKILVRGDGVEISPSYEEKFRLALTSVTNANAVVEEDTVKLTWENPDNPNFKEVVVIRKEKNASTSVGDGEEVYRGSGEKFTDANIAADASYVYSIYAHDLNADYTEPDVVYVDTYRYSLYGTVLDENTQPVSVASVKLKSESGRFINLATTDAKGLFSFNSMNPGDYSLTFSHNNYSFSKNEINVSIEGNSLEVNNQAQGKETLSIGMSQRLQAGTQTSIAWAGLHIDEGSKVDIILDKNGTTKTIATGINYNKHTLDWMVESLEEDTNLTATVKIMLSDNPEVSSQRDVLILAKIKYAYDFNHDNVVDASDIAQVTKRWQAKIGDENYASLYDVNKDGRIDIKDIMLVVHEKETL